MTDIPAPVRTHMYIYICILLLLLVILPMHVSEEYLLCITFYERSSSYICQYVYW